MDIVASSRRKTWRRGIRPGLLLACAVAAPQASGQDAPFTEEAAIRGIDYEIAQGVEQLGVGVAFADLDNDHDPDLVVLGRADGAVGLFENDGTGHFTDRTATSGIPPLPSSSGVTASDYDGDGDLDLHFANWLTADRLLRNDGGFSFVDVTASAGVGSEGASGGCGWADYDGDTWLDLYVPARTGTDLSPVRNRLYRNRGDGTFEDVAETLGVTDGDAPSLLMTWFDYDRDGDADIYLGNDKGGDSSDWVNRLWENSGGTFVDVTAASGTEAHIECMGMAVGDLDRNGFSDLYMTNIPTGNLLLMNRGDGTFEDRTTPAGLWSYRMGWGTMFFDYSNNTWLDIFVCNEGSPDRLYRNTGQWPLLDAAYALGVAETGSSYGLAAADVDDDGDLDLAVSTLFKPLRLYINHTGEQRSWVKFEVVGQGNNVFGVGAAVELEAGGARQLRELLCGNNYKSQNDFTLHFGLDQAAMADEIVVHWPGGDTARTLRNYPVQRTWTLYPPERLGDGNGDGKTDRRDLPFARACYTGAGPGNLTPGCELFDMDGDGDVDDEDLAAIAGLKVGGPQPAIP